jgi:hypothetical protein
MQYMRLIGPMLAMAGAVVPAAAQPPAADIWVADLHLSGDEIQVGTPRNITRRPGYDNQPCFLPGGDAFLFVAADSLGRTDVFRFDVVDGLLSRVTRTDESEYSPTPLAAPEGGFVTVRVEADSTQRLWRFDPDGSNPRLIASEVDSVGYFAWWDERTLVVFVVGSPHTLRLVDVATQKETVIARDIGRSILVAPGGRGVSFLAREGDGTYAFRLLPLPEREPEPLIDAVGDGQDAAWIDDALVMAGGARLFAARPFEAPRWREVADFAGAGIAAVTRIAVSPDHRRIALVGLEPAP